MRQAAAPGRRNHVRHASHRGRQPRRRSADDAKRRTDSRSRRFASRRPRAGSIARAGEWKDGDTLFTSVTCWRALAENVHLSLRKGNSVIVIGRLSVRPYETRDGEKRQSVDIDAMAVGPGAGSSHHHHQARRAFRAAIRRRRIRSPDARTIMALDRRTAPMGTTVSTATWSRPAASTGASRLANRSATRSVAWSEDVPHMDEDGTGPVIDPFAAAAGLAQTARAGRAGSSACEYRWSLAVAFGQLAGTNDRGLARSAGRRRGSAVRWVRPRNVN